MVPQLNDKAGFLKRLIPEILPSLSPQFFPDFKVDEWIHQRPYQLRKVWEFEEQRNQLIEQAEQVVDGFYRLPRSGRHERQRSSLSVCFADFHRYIVSTPRAISVQPLSICIFAALASTAKMPIGMCLSKHAALIFPMACCISG